jgi:hypothetical protein
MAKPNSLSHLTQEECDKIIDILFDFREGIAQVGDELVNDNTSTREMIDLNNELNTKYNNEKDYQKSEY